MVGSGRAWLEQSPDKKDFLADQRRTWFQDWGLLVNKKKFSLIRNNLLIPRSYSILEAVQITSADLPSKKDHT